MSSGEISLELPGGVQFVCKPPGQKAWDGYLDKIARGQQRAGQKQILLGACTSHNPEQVAAILDRFPAVVEKIVGELDALSGSDHEFSCDFEAFTFSVEVDGEALVFDAPNGHRYEQLQRNLEDQKIGFGPAVRLCLMDLCQSKDLAENALSKYPTLIGPAMPVITRMAGAELKVTVKKG